MEFKKDIGNYFKENLEQLDYSPSEKVWDGIEIELKQKKKRRFIFWIYFAVITVVGWSAYTYFNANGETGKSSPNSVVNTNTDTSNSNNSNTGSNINRDKTSSANADKNENERIAATESATIENAKINENNLKNRTDSKYNLNIRSKKAAVKGKSKNSTGITTKKMVKTNPSSKGKTNNNKKSKTSLIAKNINSKHSGKIKKTQKSNINDADSEAYNTFTPLNTDSENNSSSMDLNKTLNNPVSEKDKKPNLDELKKANQQKRDSIIAARKTEKEKKNLTEKLKDKEKDSTSTQEKKSENGVIIAPYIGYNYNGNFGNGNFLNDSKTSKKNSEFSTSYGVLVRWMATETFGIQSGIGIINSNYSATFVKKSNNFIPSNTALLSIPLSEINVLFPSNDTLGTEVTATHKTSFIEVPLEAYYVFQDTKLGFATSFGISALIHQRSDLFLESNTVSQIKIGELKNVSSFSFSGNIKLNLFYKISEKLQFDLYPEFQYQIMEFKDASNYHPYYFSIKTGFNYKL